MPELQTRYPCPVCLGVKLEQACVAQTAKLVVDHCARCGGVWFEQGEVQRLRKCEPQALWSIIAQREGVHSMQCHQCHAFVSRTQQRCQACGWKIRLDCPVCLRPMEQAEHGGIHLDACRHCRGVWFDHNELAAIWQTEWYALSQRRGALSTAGDGSLIVLDALLYDPFVAYFGIQAAGHALGGAVNAAAHAPELIGGAAEAASEVASSVFETIVEIISGIFG
jgi:Zn-finger nucleic acid-binding protein